MFAPRIEHLIRKRVSKERRNHGWGYARLGHEMSKVGAPTERSWSYYFEKADREETITPEQLIALCDVFKLRPDQLVTDPRQKRQHLTPEELELVARMLFRYVFNFKDEEYSAEYFEALAHQMECIFIAMSEIVHARRAEEPREATYHIAS